MIFKSKYPDVAPVDHPLHEWVLGDASRRGTRSALVDVASGRTLTYGELAALVRGIAAGLAAEGIGKGDVVALHSPNTVLFPVVLYATTAAGGTVTTLSPLATPAEIAKQLIDAEARLMVSVSALVETARAAVELVRRQTGRDIEILVCDKAEGHRSVLGLLSDCDVPVFESDPAVDVAVLPYSSGTTGVPKGVMLTHRNLCTNLEQMNELHRVDENDRVIAILPFFHIFGLTALVNNALRRGATVYVHARFDLDAFLTSLERDRITHAYVAPPVMLALAKHPAVGKLDLSHLRRVICAAAPLDAGVQTAVAERLGVEIGQAYGMTELSPASHLHADGNRDEPVACVGDLLPSTQARLVDPVTGLDAAAGEPGEVWIRGPQVMKGYFGRPEDTDALVDGDGWLHTGDIARVDENGNWFIVDRVKELIKYKGYQVAPAELEAILVSHPGIADAAVIGVYDEEGNEVPKAFVVPTPGASLTADEVMAHVEGQVAPYKRIRRVEFIEAVPKAASGKILRRRLRERARP
ncbi:MULTISPECIES: AMP-binding protein [Streptomyces]|uniref:AMP-binding protein n=1 Tax=Streptomyces TaxID=1883 RepID=UPI0015C512FE|nr:MULTISPECIES: AMP-binding protein [Streptomyces]MDX2528224.1 AMP-binding protein [Streptomyces europaeiscabiei]MDX2757174.1 AMP-binding protein [Streptomyces europaeiscabiei]MDX2766842.1 AMP-binding protein [Streptomyces europaeiscabiei]MDX3584664.1 AMP-binding protein [Streptomyces europaeiscabiei]MDX3611700.1 AMP-binding protein [Streptomyces europaeiscabiei]